MPPDYATADQLFAVTSKIAEFADKVDGLADILARTRAPSKAALVGGAPMARSTTDGAFIRAVMQSRSRSAQEQAEGKATLDGLGVRYVEEGEGKAATGLTDAAGGWVMPNAIVEDLLKPALMRNPYRALMRVVDGVRTASVDIPWRGSAPARAGIVVWGQQKPNVDLVYNGYTATMYTMARIHDVSTQFVRYSAGAAEADVIGELGHALALGEAYYIRDGVGTTEPYGFIPALAGIPAYTSTFTPAATLAGSVLAAVATAASALIARGRRPEAAVVGADGYTGLLTQGGNDSGFYLAGLNGIAALPGFATGTPITPFGIPIVLDPGLAADDLVLGEWSSMRFYVGAGPRVDTSSESGTRWDYNVTGFRGEEDIAFDARPGVYAGCLQYVADILP